MRWNGWALGGLALAVLSPVTLDAPAQAQQAAPPAPPGFRPESPLAEAFVESLDDAEVVVLPTVVRGPEWITHSVASQRLIVELLDEDGQVTATTGERRIDLGAAPHESQWALFQNALETMAAAVDRGRSGGDYTLMMEVLFQPGDRIVFGIQTYLVDGQGRNVFSFLLNAHHEVFKTAELVASDDTDEARETVVAKATRVGVMALEAQLDHARACTAWMAANPAQPMGPGVFEGFESGLPAVRDASGIPLGFSTFTDGPSKVSIDTTSAHPPRPGEAAGNVTLRVDLDVTGWAGFVDLTHDMSTRTWRPQDWSGFEGLSFWMFGRNTGTRMFVDVLDNRAPCSAVDDAERYVYEFSDDFSGWKQISIPFRDMVRKEIGNGAPDDGLGLARVHGWAFGAQSTGGPRTWYLDDVALWTGGGGQ